MSFMEEYNKLKKKRLGESEEKNTMKSFMEEYNKLKEKRLSESENKTSTNFLADERNRLKLERQAKADNEKDIAPVAEPKNQSFWDAFIAQYEKAKNAGPVSMMDYVSKVADSTTISAEKKRPQNRVHGKESEKSESFFGKLEAEYNKYANDPNTLLNKARNLPEAQSVIKAADKLNENIAPVIKPVTDAIDKKINSAKGEDGKLDFFQPGAFDDGYQAGDVTKALLGTVGDTAIGAFKGFGSMIEGGVDLVEYGAANVAKLFGSEEWYQYLKEDAQKNVIEKWTKGLDGYFDQYSILGKTSDAVTQGIGQLALIYVTGGIGAAAGLSSAGTTALTTGTLGFSSMGSAMGEAYASGASDGEAITYGLIAGVAEAGTELIFGGLGKTINAKGLSTGLSSADDMLAKKVSGLFKNQIAKNISEYGVKAAGEGVEEVLSGVLQAVGKKITYMTEEDLDELLKDENLLEQFVVGSVTSAFAQSGYIPGTRNGSLAEANKTGRDFITGLNQNEQTVIDRVYKDRLAEAEKTEKITGKEKTKIYDEVVSEMEKGAISTDTIESILAEDTYKSYKDTIESEESMKKELDELQHMEAGKMNDIQRTRMEELKGMNLNDTSKRDSLKAKLDEEVLSKVKDSRLSESYNEKSKRGQTFQADIKQYDTKQRSAVQRAIDSGILNNTNRTHEFVDLIAKISADKGVLFDFTNNKKLKESGFAVEGRTINGYVTKDGISINIDSAKSWQTVVGHEVTHVLEGTEFYNELQSAITEYAKSKGEYQSKYDSLTKLYQNIEGADIDAELTADLVGDYLFSDEDFIKNLSANHRNVFQKIYDEIKYLIKVATAGSKEAKQLEKVKKAFEKVYHESGNQTDLKHDNLTEAKYSLGEIIDQSGNNYGIGVRLDSTLLDNLSPKERLGMVKEYIRELGGKSFTAYNKGGDKVSITIAKSNAKFENRIGKKVPVNKDLASKYIGNEVKQESIALIDELITASEYDGSASPKYAHGWLDNNGKNNWEYWTTYVQDKNNTIWQATLNVANAADGTKFLYDIGPIKKVERSVKSDTFSTNNTVPREAQSVNSDYMQRSAKDSLLEDIAPVRKDVATTAKNTEITFETLTSKKDMNITRIETTLDDVINKSRTDIVNEAKENLSSLKDPNGVIKIHNDDTNMDIAVGKSGIEHGLDRNYNYTAMVSMNLESYLKNAIKINEATADKQRTHDSDILLGYGETASGEKIPAYFVVSKLKTGLTELVEFGSLYSMRAKKISGDSTQGGSGFRSSTPDTISILKLLDIVNAEYSDILPKTVAEHYGNVRRSSKLGNSVKNSLSVDSDEVFSPDRDRIVPLRDLRREANTDDIGPVKTAENINAESFENIAPVRTADQGRTAHETFPDDFAPVSEKASRENIETNMTEPETKTDETSSEETAKEPKRVKRAQLHSQIVDKIKTEFSKNGFDFDKVLKNAKNLSTFSTVDNTPQRVMEKALGYKEGNILSDLTVNKVAQNETEGIKWLNSYTDRKTGLLAQISKQYGIKPGSKESAAAQMYAEGFYVAKNNDILKYGDEELMKDFKDIRVQEKIKSLARDPRIRQIYDETLNMINESRKRNAYPEIPRLDNYFLHFRAMNDTFSRLGLPFNPNDIRAKDLPTDLNGVTADLKPGQPYFASSKHRLGKRTSFDLLGGLENYLTSAKNQIYHIDDIQTLRALRNYIADTYGQANGLENLDVLSEEEAQERIKEVYDSHLSTFAKFLNEEANVIAGKTALIDRGLEGIIGRRGITFLNTLNKQVGSNMVGFNVSSSLTNFLSVAQAFAKTNKFAFVKGFAQTVSNKIKSISGESDGFAENNPTIIRRKGAERFQRNLWQKVGDLGYVMAGAVDNISTEIITRAKYNELIGKGMDNQKAIEETDKWVSRLMGDRSLGQQPQLYNSKMLGLVTKFQLEVRNQLDSQFYDTIQEARVSNEDVENGLKRNAKIAAKITSTFVQLAVAQHLFGKAFESIAGYNPAFDIIDAIIKTFGWDDDEDSEDTIKDNVEQGVLALIEDMPYSSILTGTGRIPIASALPISDLISGKDEYGNEKSRWKTIGETVPYYLLPGGYGQLKKTANGLKMFDDDLPVAGSYTDSGNLRFPVDDTLKSKVQAGIFGQWASQNARDYFDNDIAPLKEKQIKEFVDVDIPIQDYWKYRKGLSKQKTLEEKFDYIADLDLPVKKKNILINNVVDRKEPVDLENYDDFSDYEEFDFATKNPEKYEFLMANKISFDDYNFTKASREAYSWAFENPEKYTLSKAISSDIITYRKYSDDLANIKSDKDTNGNSISGSRKEKVIRYINNLDGDYGEKIILFKSEYPSDDTYNNEIIEYLNDRDDISYEEMETILKELGFSVLLDGTISWK